MNISYYKISSIFVLLFVSHDIYATSAGENIWNIISEIATQTDTLNNLSIDAVEPCTLIGQSDVGAGTYVISNPGVYCVYETITSSYDPIIAIASDDVVLNLNGHVVIGDAGSNIGIGMQAPGYSNVLIKNGTLRDCFISIDNNNTGPVGITDLSVFRSAGSSEGYFSNITGFIGKNLKIYDTVNPLVFQTVSGLFLNNVVSFGVSFQSNCTNIAVVNGVSLNRPWVMNSMSNALFYHVISLVSSGAGFELQVPTSNIFFDNCIGMKSGADGFVADSSTDLAVNDFIIAGATGVGFNALGSNQFGFISDAVVVSSTVSGFNLTADPSSLVAGSVAHNNPINFVSVPNVVVGPTNSTTYWVNVSATP